MADQQLNLYTAFSYTREYFQLEAGGQEGFRREFVDALQKLATATHFYTVFPTRHEFDVVVWSAFEAPETAQPGDFFVRYHESLEPLRKCVEPKTVLWGFTRPSMYARGKSEQDIDPFDGERSPYLVIYPFSKTASWYMKSMDARQGMMNEHIKLGKQYPAIKQLLLYTFGLQDQEFVVSYETDDLVLFSKLVQELRSTEARVYTSLDTPIITGIYRRPEEFVD